MRKLSKLLAFGLAMVLTFGMTVSAAENSTNTGASNAETEALTNQITGATVDVEGVTVELGKVFVESKEEADEILKNFVEEDGIEDATIIAATDVQVSGANGQSVTVTLAVNGVEKGKEYVAFHLGKNGWEALEVVVLADGKIQLTSDDWSPVYIVEVEVEDEDDEDDEDEKKEEAAVVVSPKTGEVMPIASIMAVICLAGVAVCAKKARD